MYSAFWSAHPIIPFLEAATVVMAANILFLPGLLGSNIGYFPPDGSAFQPCWMDIGAILQGELKYLQLDQFGVGPGPLAEGRVLSPTGIFGPAYSPFVGFLDQLLGPTVAVAYDWRFSILANTAKVAAAAIAAFGDNPFWLVAHSLGGLLALQTYSLLVAQGRGDQVSGVVTICTPHYGCFEIVRLFNRLPLTYKAIVIASGWADYVAGHPGPGYIDATLATWPGVYELLPFAASGPLFEADPAQAAALYGLFTYKDGNPFLETSLFGAAKITQSQLARAGPRGRTFCIAGIGQTTSYSLSGLGDLTAEAGYLTTLLGDGEVTVAEASLAGAPVALTPTTHGLACLDPGVWALVYAAIAGAGSALADFRPAL